MVDHTNLHDVIAGRQGPPVSSTLLGDFARYLQDEALVPTAGTILSYCRDVANLCAAMHFPRPPLPPLLQRALEREAAAHPTDNAKAPASPEFLAAFIHDSAIPLVLRTAAVLLWFTTLRGSEILANTTTVVGDFCLRRQDVSFAPDGSFIRLGFRRGKPFAHNEPSLRVLTRPGEDQPWAVDPVAFVLAYLQGTQRFGDAEPLLRHVDGALATYRQMLDAVKLTARKLGLDESEYGVHSLRSGGVTAMRAHGVADADIRAQGGWLSEGGDAPYRRPNVEQSRRAQRALAIPKPGLAPPGASPGGLVAIVTASTPLLSPAAAIRALAGPRPV